GNVSLYNEGVDGPIYPTPVVGLVGRLPDAAGAGRLGFAREGDAIALVGRPFLPDLAGSELAKLRREPRPDHLGAWDLAECGAASPWEDPLRHLFGEGPGGFVLSGLRAALEALGDRLDVFVCGEVGGGALEISMDDVRISVALERLRKAHDAGLSAHLG